MAADPDLVQQRTVVDAFLAAERGGAQATQPALVNGSVGVVVAPQGHLVMVLCFTINDGKNTLIDVIADPARLQGLEIALLSV